MNEAMKKMNEHKTDWQAVILESVTVASKTMMQQG